MFKSAIVNSLGIIENIVLLPNGASKKFMLSDSSELTIGSKYNIEQATSPKILNEDSIIKTETHWRNQELYRTDTFLLLPDYPHKSAMMFYRQKLRDYPKSDNIHLGIRPELII